MRKKSSGWGTAVELRTPRENGLLSPTLSSRGGEGGDAAPGSCHWNNSVTVSCRGARRKRPSRGALWLLAGVLFWNLIPGAQGQTNYQRIHSFGNPMSAGAGPRGQLLEASDGLLYGTTYSGGSNNLGVIFKVRRDGGGYAALLSFQAAAFPYAGVVEGSDGALYGTTFGGGTNTFGTVFKVNKDGSAFSILRHFSSGIDDGGWPLAGLIVGKDNALYGTTAAGGTSNLGTVFRLSTDGGGYTNLHQFTGAATRDGGGPFAALIQASDGMLYGATQNGGSNDFGTVFKVSTNGGGYSILHHFAGGSDGRLPLGGLVQANGGVLYGTTYYGAGGDLGIVFKLNTNGGNYGVVYSFAGGGDGSGPFSGLVQGSE